jgi:hypothetical protein
VQVEALIRRTLSMPTISKDALEQLLHIRLPAARSDDESLGATGLIEKGPFHRFDVRKRPPQLPWTVRLDVRPGVTINKADFGREFRGRQTAVFLHTEPEMSYTDSIQHGAVSVHLTFWQSGKLSSLLLKWEAPKKD